MKESVISRGRVRKACMAEVLNSKQREKVISRVFGKKDKDDIFELYDLSTNLPCEDFSENIGVELFGIDAASFGRTVFFSQKDCESAPTDGIHAKLGNLIEQTDDIHNFQSVYDNKKKNRFAEQRKT